MSGDRRSDSRVTAAARQLVAQGRIGEAFNAYLAALVRGDEPGVVRAEFGCLLADCGPFKPHPVIDEIFVRALAERWIRPEALAVPAARYLASKWPRALSGAPAPGEPQLIELLRDPLLLALIQSTPAATPALDVLLARFRYSSLRAAVAGKDLETFIPTLAGLALRGWHSGYALVLPLLPRHEDQRKDEAQMLARLGRELERGTLQGGALSAGIAVFGCYAAPSERHLRAGLATGDPVAQLLSERVTRAQERQRDIARALQPATPIRPESVVVAEQYEAHPYPAWVAEPPDPVQLPQPVVRALGPNGLENAGSVLVAGCGTGQHAIAAMHSWPEAEILALDLSRTSLGYAIDQTRDPEFRRISFALGDLLESASLGRRFDVIEAMGVLHHLEDPEAGLRALRDALAPAGLIGIALYSKAARGDLAALRERYGKDARSDEEIRQFRAWALAEAVPPGIVHASDFYSIGGCRDAIFHVREKGYTLPEIEKLLEAAGLRLLAIQTPPGAHRLLESLPAPADLAGWASAEQRHPHLFLSMYELWAQDVRSIGTRGASEGA